MYIAKFIGRIFANIIILYGGFLLIAIPIADVVDLAADWVFINYIVRLIFGGIPGYLFVMAGTILMAFCDEAIENMNYLENTAVFFTAEPLSFLGKCFAASITCHIAAPIFGIVFWIIKLAFSFFGWLFSIF